MRKFLALAATVILGGALLIAGCGNDNNKQAANNGKQVLKIGATAVPHAEILEQVKPILAKMVLIYKSLNSLITTHQTLLWVIKKSMQTSSNMYLTWMNSQKLTTFH